MPRAGESDAGSLQAGAAEAQVGAERIGQGDEFDKAAVGRHHRDTATDQRGDAEVWVPPTRHPSLDSEAIRQIQALGHSSCLMQASLAWG